MLQSSQVRCNRSEVRLEMVAVSILFRTSVVKTTEKKKSGFPVEFRTGNVQHAAQNHIVEEHKSSNLFEDLSLLGWFTMSNGFVAFIFMVEQSYGSVIFNLAWRTTYHQWKQNAVAFVRTKSFSSMYCTDNPWFSAGKAMKQLRLTFSVHSEVTALNNIPIVQVCRLESG